LRNVRHCFVQGVRARPGTKAFCQLAGRQTTGVLVSGSDLTEAEIAFQLEPGVDKNALRQEGSFLPSW
jgi:hypothetical protein